MAKKNGAKNRAVKGVEQSTDDPKKTLYQLRGVDINTEDGQRIATNGLWDALAAGTADPDNTRAMLSTLGKVLVRENMKIRAGVYKVAGASNRFFLTA
jgi:hypothetical protein